jgi:glycosyltransferase involved in cell wall biosynthesis
MGSLGLVSLEAIACGRPVIAYVSSEYTEYKDFPLRDLNQEEEIAGAIESFSDELLEKEYAYLEKNHIPSVVISKLLNIYKEYVEDMS